VILVFVARTRSPRSDQLAKNNRATGTRTGIVYTPVRIDIYIYIKRNIVEGQLFEFDLSNYIYIYIFVVGTSFCKSLNPQRDNALTPYIPNERVDAYILVYSISTPIILTLRVSREIILFARILWLEVRSVYKKPVYIYIYIVRADRPLPVYEPSERYGLYSFPYLVIIRPSDGGRNPENNDFRVRRGGGHRPCWRRTYREINTPTTVRICPFPKRDPDERTIFDNERYASRTRELPARPSNGRFISPVNGHASAGSDRPSAIIFSQYDGPTAPVVYNSTPYVVYQPVSGSVRIYKARHGPPVVDRTGPFEFR